MSHQFRLRREGIEIAEVLNDVFERWKKRTGLGLSALAGAIERNHAWACKVLEQKLHLHADSIAIITRLTNDTALVETIARQCGGTFVRDPQPGCLSESKLRHVLTETASVTDEYLTAIEDGHVTNAEALAVLRSVDRAVQRLHEFRGCVTKHAQPRQTQKGIM